MIQVGDIVRYSNAYLKFLGSKYSLKHAKRRGKQELFRVVKATPKLYEWRRRNFYVLLTLDDGRPIDSTWMRFVRRPKKAMACGSQLINANTVTPVRRRRSALPVR